MPMWTDEEFEALEESEHELTIEELAIMLLILTECRNNFLNELATFYRKYGKDGIITYNEARKYISNVDRRRRMTVLFLFLNNSLESAVNEIDGNFEALLTAIITKESDFFNVTFPKDDFVKTKWGVDELSWQERLLNNKNRWLVNIQRDLKQSWLRGLSIDDVLAQMDKRFTTMENVLEALVGSEVTAMSSMARKEILKDLDINHYRFYSRGDERRCEICGGLHGKEFPMSQYEVGVTAPPVHTNCRCWTVPVE